MKIPGIKKWFEYEPISKVSDPSINPQTNDGTAVAQYGDLLYVIFRNQSNNRLRFMTMDATGNWSGDADINVDGNTLQTSEAPAAVAYNGYLFVAYRKKGSEDLSMTRFDGKKWDWGTTIKSISNKKISPKTKNNPGMAVFKDTLYVAYSGSSKMSILSYDGNTWGGSEKMKSSDGDQLRCDKGPALASFNGLLFCCWQGNSSSRIYQATWDGSGHAWDNWENYRKVQVSRGIKDLVRTDKYPTLVPFGKKLFLFHKGNHSNKIYQLSLKKEAWKGDLPIALLSDYDIQSNKGVGAGVFTYMDGKREKSEIVLISKDPKTYNLSEAKRS